MAPTSNGIDVDHVVVPAAVPVDPVLVDHVTEVTPTLSLAVPLIVIAAAAVDTDVAPGDAIVSAGGVVSVTAGAACLVTVTTCDT